MTKYWKSLNFIKNTCLVDFDLLDDVSKKVPVNAKQIEAYNNLRELVSRAAPKEPIIYWDEAGYWSALCPSGCLATVGEGNSCEDHFKNNFCHCCGQAILWEVQDEG